MNYFLPLLNDADEGVLFQSFGLEGETFEYKDGAPQLKEHVTLVEETEGKKMLYKFISLTDFYEMRKHLARLAAHDCRYPRRRAARDAGGGLPAARAGDFQKGIS